MFEDVFVVVSDFLNELIIDRAFDKKRKLKNGIPYIIIYYITVLGLFALSFFLGINYILVHNFFGYLLLIISLCSLIMLIVPFVYKKKNS